MSSFASTSPLHFYSHFQPDQRNEAAKKTPIFKKGEWFDNEETMGPASYFASSMAFRLFIR
ncbi:hypothetical protein B23_3522 [Geobacillus thermoleovorans B23]|nr:hypothetical protein B23_3522 [Geobacillus thermoleovorans B23]